MNVSDAMPLRVQLLGPVRAWMKERDVGPGCPEAAEGVRDAGHAAEPGGLASPDLRGAVVRVRSTRSLHTRQRIGRDQKVVVNEARRPGPLMPLGRAIVANIRGLPSLECCPTRIFAVDTCQNRQISQLRMSSPIRCVI